MGGLFAGQPAEPSPDAVFDRFMSVVCAPDYREVLTRALGTPTWSGRSVRAARVGCPTVVVVGSASLPPVHDVATRLAAWLRTASVETIAGGDHLLPLRQPSVFAASIAALAAAER